MTSSRPYIIRGLYEWILDNDLTPYLLVDVSVGDVIVPQQYVKDGQIVLNISPTAVVALDIGNDAVNFNGRFGGVPSDIYVPVGAVIGIYARENGQGMVFDPEQTPDHPPPTDTPPSGGNPISTLHKTGVKPSLKVVK